MVIDSWKYHELPANKREKEKILLESFEAFFISRSCSLCAMQYIFFCAHSVPLFAIARLLHRRILVVFSRGCCYEFLIFRWDETARTKKITIAMVRGKALPRIRRLNVYRVIYCSTFWCALFPIPSNLTAAQYAEQLFSRNQLFRVCHYLNVAFRITASRIHKHVKRNRHTGKKNKVTPNRIFNELN